MLLFICGSCLAEDTIPSKYSTQTSWNNGSVVARAAGEWSNEFETSEGIDWFNENGSLTLIEAYYRKPLSVDSMPTVTGIHPSDLDMDGDLDLITLHSQESRVGWLQNTGHILDWEYYPLIDNIYAPRTCIASDLDNDGMKEIVVASNEDGIIVVDQVTEDGWISHNIDREFYRCIDLSCSDIDGDGFIDIVGMSKYTGKISWFSNPGIDGGDWIEHVVGRIPDEHTRIITADLDSDGHQEIVTMKGSGRVFSPFRYEEEPSRPWLEHEGSIEEDGFSRINAYFTDRYDTTSAMGILFHESDDRTVVTVDQCAVDTLEGIDSLNIRYEYTLGDIDGDGDMDICTRTGCYEDVGRNSLWLFHPYEINPEFSDYSLNTSQIRKMFCIDYDSDGMDELVFLTQNQLWYVDHIPEFIDRGELISQPLAVDDWHTWCSMSWDAEVPEGTSISIYFHFYQNLFSSSSPDWIGPFSEPVSLLEYYGEAIQWGQEYLANDFYPEPKYLQYLQYKVEMTSSDPSVSPVLNSITVEWK